MSQMWNGYERSEQIMKKASVVLMLFIILIYPLIADDENNENDIKQRMSIYLYQGIGNPFDDSAPIDYELLLRTTYNENIDMYYIQKRNNGISQREYSLDLQHRVYKQFYVAGKRYSSPKSDLWAVDLKWLYDESGWKTYLGISSCWDPKYSAKILLEERKTIRLDFFLIPTEILLSVRTLSDFKRFYHEEKVNAKFMISLPTSWKLNKYINLSLNLFISSKDYGYYRWEEKLMIGIDIIK